jgi:hypothetical protein
VTGQQYGSNSSKQTADLQTTLWPLYSTTGVLRSLSPPLQVAVAVPLSLGLQKFFGVKGNSSEPDAGD